MNLWKIDGNGWLLSIFISCAVLNIFALKWGWNIYVVIFSDLSFCSAESGMFCLNALLLMHERLLCIWWLSQMHISLFVLLKLRFWFGALHCMLGKSPFDKKMPCYHNPYHSVKILLLLFLFSGGWPNPHFSWFLSLASTMLFSFTS